MRENIKALFVCMGVGVLIGVLIGITLVRYEMPSEVIQGWQKYNQIMDRDEEVFIGKKHYKCIQIYE